MVKKKLEKDSYTWKKVKRNDKYYVYLFYEGKLKFTTPYKKHKDKRSKKGYRDNTDYNVLKKEEKFVDFEKKYKKYNRKQKVIIQDKEIKVKPKKGKFYSKFITKIRFNICAFDQSNNSNQFIPNKFYKERGQKSYNYMLNKILSSNDKFMINEYLNDDKYIITGGVEYTIVGFNGDKEKWEIVKTKQFSFNP